MRIVDMDRRAEGDDVDMHDADMEEACAPTFNILEELVRFHVRIPKFSRRRYTVLTSL